MGRRGLAPRSSTGPAECLDSALVDVLGSDQSNRVRYASSRLVVPVDGQTMERRFDMGGALEAATDSISISSTERTPRRSSKQERKTFKQSTRCLVDGCAASTSLAL